MTEENPLIRFFAFFQTPEIFKQELWNLLINFKTKKYNEVLEYSIKSYLYNIYLKYKDCEEVIFISPEHMTDNIQVICDFLNYTKKIKNEDPKMFEVIFMDIAE